MRVKSFSISKYRSITEANRLPINDSTILIGPNNQGKTNILRAFVTLLYILRGMHGGMRNRLRLGMNARRYYDWETDFPISLREREKGSQCTAFTLELEIDDDERIEFKKMIGRPTDPLLKIKVKIGRESSPQLSVVRRGPGGGKRYAEKSQDIAKFISDRLICVHIPAIRTERSALEIVEGMVSRELSVLEEDPQYRKAVKAIESKQMPVLKRISNTIKCTLNDFLPNISDVDVKISRERRSRALRESCDVIINDGVPTLLENKGDGVKSLVVMGLMRHASEQSAVKKNLILAIEEPESHLHPTAIHRLRRVIMEFSGKRQVIISTHCPLFVDRENLASNIVVSGRKPVPAKDIESIRNVLGVRAADNLMHAELILVVEGRDDEKSIGALLKHYSSRVRNAFHNGTLVIEPVHGVAKLPYNLNLLRTTLCSYHCLLDNDQEAQNAYCTAEGDGLITPAEVTYTKCRGMTFSELEDWYDVNIYKVMISEKYGVSIGSASSRTRKQKWSEWMKRAFDDHGKNWTRDAKKVKREIAEIVASNPEGALNKYGVPVFRNYLSAIEEKLGVGN